MSIWWLAALGVFFIFLPIIVARFYLVLVPYILIAGLLALSFNLLFGFMGRLSFGHAAFFGVGAYTVALLATRTDVPLPISILSALLVCGIIALIVGYLSVRLRGYYFAILTMAFGQLLFVIVFKWYSLTSGDDGIHGIPVPSMLESITGQYYFVLVLTGIAMIVLWRIIGSPFGYTLRSIRDNEVRAEFNGINVMKYQLIAFVIAGIFAGFAGALFAPFNRSITPHMLDWTKSAEPVIMSVIGGQFTFFGPLVGAAIFILLQSFSLRYTLYWQMIIGIIFIVVVLFMPGGVLGFLLEKFRRFRV